jgi:hypothetical protein
MLALKIYQTLEKYKLTDAVLIALIVSMSVLVGNTTEINGATTLTAHYGFTPFDVLLFPVCPLLLDCFYSAA